MVQSNQKGIIIYAKAIASAFGLICLMDPSFSLPTVAYILVFLSTAYLFQQVHRNGSPHYWQSHCVGLTFTLFVILGEKWLDPLFDSFTVKKLSCLIIASIGIYALFQQLLNILFSHWAKNTATAEPGSKKQLFSSGMVFALSFSMLWFVYFLFFLNQYPGSLSCDTPNQLAQAMGDAPFENANPLINTLLLTFFLKAGFLIGNSVNSGIAFYTFFQFSLTALIFAYTITLLYKAGVNKWILLLSQLFYNCMPYNIIYANGMWKDTFFAILFLASLAFTFECVYFHKGIQKGNLRKLIILFLLVLMASLARNSGWSSLLVLGFALLVYGKTHKHTMITSIAKVKVLSVLCALLVIGFVYPALGVKDNGGLTSALSVPLQQISRVVAHNGDISEEERNVLNEFLPVDQISGSYNPTISDPIKILVNDQALSRNPAKYAKLWLKVGIKNPKAYFDAFTELTKRYWYLDECDWTWDTRIFENPYGVCRTPLLLPHLDAAHELNSRIRFPKEYVLSTSSIILWTAIIMCAFAGIRKNQMAVILLTPIFAVFIGLLFTSPVALFRYTYAAAVCMPLIVAIPFLDFERHSKPV